MSTNTPEHDPANDPQDDAENPEDQEGQTDPENPADGQEDGDTFPRSYVEKLRQESKGYRDRAKRGETAITRLTEATVREATNGILVDSSDLTFDEKTMTDDDGFPDPEKIKTAAEELVTRKPHLAPRRPRGDIGQGVKKTNDDFSLAGILRNNAG